MTFSRDYATQMGLNMLQSGWVSRKSGGQKKSEVCRANMAYSHSRLDAATPSITSFRLCLTIASQIKWSVTISDVASALLNASLPPEATNAVETPSELDAGRRPCMV